MGMSTVTTEADLVTRLGELMSQIERGEEVVILRENEPFARITPVQRPRRQTPLEPGFMAGTLKIIGDVTGPLIPEEDWEMLK